MGPLIFANRNQGRPGFVVKYTRFGWIAHIIESVSLVILLVVVSHWSVHRSFVCSFNLIKVVVAGGVVNFLFNGIADCCFSVREIP